jgi:hypothetical protein
MMRFISSPNWQKGYLVPRLLLLGAATLISFSISASQPTGTEKHSLKTIEIAGISLNTPPETIAKILKAQDYIPVNETLYTKQEPAQNGRSTVYRVEIEDTATSRQLSYFRSLTGGRNKSPSARDAAIPAAEMITAQQLYNFVCAVPQALQTERACMPQTAANIIFGHGQLIAIDAHYSALLKASDSSTSMIIKYAE